ncbi:unnamed protein product [Trichogramma brassicae]|uniref:Uncharacterized protein n=1 Tax=Trichogramma brassicae TaxID=86971 RepID=A0A6H5J9F2_9HYME|nr:unnamed protein product [Trichogramma brassicae]
MNSLTGQFRKTTWDPILIVAQIIAVQCLLYFILGIMIIMIATLLGTTKSLDYLFFIFILNSIVGALALWYLVQRTKQCMDFLWCLNLVTTTIMCVCGEFLCMKTELKAIPLSMLSQKTAL